MVFADIQRVTWNFGDEDLSVQFRPCRMDLHTTENRF